MKRLPRKAANIQKKGYKQICDGFNWDLASQIWGKRVRINGKEVKECEIVDEIVDNSPYSKL